MGVYYLFRVAVIIREGEKRKQMEAALRESEARFRAVVVDQSELIMRFSPDHAVSFVNEAYCRYFGEDCDELLAEGFLHHLPPADQKRLQAHLASLGLSKPAARIEHQVVAAGGEIRWLQWIDHGIFDGAGKLLEIQAVGRDITEEKRAEEAAEGLGIQGLMFKPCSRMNLAETVRAVLNRKAGTGSPNHEAQQEEP
jgi:PAS domain S-box-containing protein